MECDCFASCKAGVSCIHVHAVQLFLGPRQLSVAEVKEVDAIDDARRTDDDEQSLSSLQEWTRKTSCQLQVLKCALNLSL